MVAKAQKWGNSLAVRLPKSLAQECGIEADSPLEISRQANCIVIKPLVRGVSLDALIEGITDENLHAETSSGKPVGREIW